MILNMLENLRCLFDTVLRTGRQVHRRWTNRRFLETTPGTKKGGVCNPAQDSDNDVAVGSYFAAGRPLLPAAVATATVLDADCPAAAALTPFPWTAPAPLVAAFLARPS